VIFKETKIDGVVVVELEERRDERGFFARAWCEREFAEQGLNPRVAQINLSHNRLKGTVRGMHYQNAPHQEAKLIRCVRGAIYDVAIDVRPESRSYGQWLATELTAENRRLLYVPEGCAHGFQTLKDDTEVLYQASEFYAPDAEAGFRWDDPAIGIEWPETAARVISDKDRSWPDFEGAAASAAMDGVRR
jgi:dTDP-4-dehydrorhamnose 3,5-epimerase